MLCNRTTKFQLTIQMKEMKHKNPTLPQSKEASVIILFIYSVARARDSSRQ